VAKWLSGFQFFFFFLVFSFFMAPQKAICWDAVKLKFPFSMHGRTIADA
jgi:hypothetical protein